MYSKRLIRAVVPRNVRNWLRAPGKSVQWAWNDLKYSVGITSTLQLRPGWNLRCHPGAHDFAYWAQESDAEQVDEFDAFVSHCSEGMVLFDIGAHFGLFSLAALHYGGPTAKALAVDPSATATRIMEVQSKLNRLEDRLRIVRAAVGDVEGVHEMVTVGLVSGGYLVAAGEDHPEREITRVRATTLDNLTNETNLSPTHIKIDVEGFEAEVIRGGRKLLSSENAPILFIELHNEMITARNADPSEALSLLKELGYQTSAVDGSRVSDIEILEKPLIRIIASKQMHGID